MTRPPANRDPVAPGNDDYPSDVTALAGAIAWLQTLAPSDVISDITFGQRNPVTVGPDRYYWHAAVRRTVHGGVDDPAGREADHNVRLRAVVKAWREAYAPAPGVTDPF